MNSNMSLNDVWQVSWTEGLHGRQEHIDPEQFDALRYIDVPVPCELHRALVEKGLLDEPNVGINSLKARWVEEQVWVYRHTFTAPDGLTSQSARLRFAGLDLNAIVYLNGHEVGRHASVHRPCLLDVTEALRPGENALAMVIESGLYGVADLEGAAYNSAPETILNKRHWLRKPQYQAGWDWNPRLINVGIIGDVSLEWGDDPWIEQLVVLPELGDDMRSASLHVTAHVINPRKDNVAGVLQAGVGDSDERFTARGEAACDLAPGENRVHAQIPVLHPHLWWPVGHGDPHLYDVAALLKVNHEKISERRTRTGIRKVEIDRSPHPDEGEYFIIKVNNRPIFCKGGNWVPPDMMAPGIPDERYRDLVALAIDANCNLLRVWGGGYYVGDNLLKWCDEAGVMVWHDMAFACSKYPADSPAFMAEVREEITWNVRDMSSHPSLVVWCGNNELEWGAWAWGYKDSGRALPDYSLFHHVIPVILKQEDPSRPYWPSSPYSADHVFPNEPTSGDQHPWSVTLQDHGPNFWAYRTFVDRFPNEGGVLGASGPATLKQCLGDDYKFRSFAWEHHDNAANFWRPDEGITYNLVEHWLGKSAQKMLLEDYCFASALLQAEGLCEYIGNYRRRMFSSSSAIFWMYNDSWPATHGWTIVDYYLRKKLAYHPVRRAFQPVTVVVAEDGDEVQVFGINETRDAWTGTLRFGVFEFDGHAPVEETLTVTIPANQATPIASIPRDRWRSVGFSKSGAFAVLMGGQGVVAQHRLLLARFGELSLNPAPTIGVTCEAGVATFRSDSFVWGAALDLDGDSPVADNAFDLLPGIDYSVPWPEGMPKPRVLRTGNELVPGQ